MHILYVDDEPSMLELTKSYLEATEDAEVVTCSSAREALGLIPSESFDAVISDYQMPEMDGIELLKAVRRDWPHIPFILFTGRGNKIRVVSPFFFQPNHWVHNVLDMDERPESREATDR